MSVQTISQLQSLSLSTKPESVTAEIAFLDPEVKEPYYYRDPVPGIPQTNNKVLNHKVEIEDIRGKENEYDLDNAGFKLVVDTEFDPEYELFDDEERIKSEYYDQITKLVKKNTGAKHVVIYDHTIRREDPNIEDSIEHRKPVLQAHVDQTPVSARKRVERHLGGDAAEYKNKRFQLINVWRPLFDDNTDHPLALGDGTTFEDKDLVVSKLIYDDYSGETFRVLYNPNQKWHYLSHQNKNETLFIKCADSKTEGTAKYTPHTAFINPLTPKDARFRESIEIRTIVFYDDEK